MVEENETYFIVEIIPVWLTGRLIELYFPTTTNDALRAQLHSPVPTRRKDSRFRLRHIWSDRRFYHGSPRISLDINLRRKLDSEVWSIRWHGNIGCCMYGNALRVSDWPSGGRAFVSGVLDPIVLLVDADVLLADVGAPILT